MSSQPWHGEAAGAEQNPEEADADQNADDPVVIKTLQQRQAEISGNYPVSKRAEGDQQRRGHAAIRVQVGAVSEFEPKPARNRQQQNHYPTDRERKWNRGE